MSGGTSRDNIEREAFNYIRLGTLLQRPRAPSRKEAVENVIQQSLPIEEKIRLIERLDAEAEGRSYEAPAKASGERQPLRKVPRTKYSVVDAAKNRADIKTEPTRNRLLPFLFRDYGFIRDFGKKTRSIERGFFPTSIRLSREGLELLNSRLASEVIPKAHRGLVVALREGWRHLRKPEYNLIAAFGRLCTEIKKVPLMGYSPRDPSVYRRLWNLENAFLLFHVDPAFRELLFSALDKVLSKDPDLDSLRRDTLSAALAVLSTGGSPPTLRDVILACAMIRSRRAVTFADLLAPGSGPYISVAEFDCTEPIQEAIDAQVDAIEKKLQGLKNEHDEIVRLRAFIARDEDKNVDYSRLSTFYNLTYGEKHNAFVKDSENSLLFAIRLADAYLPRARSLLSDELRTTAGAPVRPVLDNAYDYDLSRLALASDKLKKLQFTVQHLTMARYKAIRLGGAAPAAHEAEGREAIVEATECLARMARRLAAALRTPAGTQNGDEGLEPPLEHQDSIIVSGDAAFDGQSVREAAYSMAAVAFLAAAFFLEDSVLSALKRERWVEDEMRSLLAQAERLAAPGRFTEIKTAAGM